MWCGGIAMWCGGIARVHAPYPLVVGKQRRARSSERESVHSELRLCIFGSRANPITQTLRPANPSVNNKKWLPLH